MKGFFAPTRFEADVYDCEAIGKVPTELNGAFVRLGGDWLYPPKFEDDSPFSMDGYINMFRFKNGIVDYKGRWVKTPRFKADRAAHKQLFGTYRNPFTDDPSVKGLDRSLNAPLVFRIEVARRFIENEQARLAQQRPCEGQPLPLPS